MVSSSVFRDKSRSNDVMQTCMCLLEKRTVFNSCLVRCVNVMLMDF